MHLSDPNVEKAAALPGVEETLAAPFEAEGGDVDCTLRWFGFLDQSVRTVGTHRCRIGKAADGAVTIEKLDGVSAFWCILRLSTIGFPPISAIFPAGSGRAGL